LTPLLAVWVMVFDLVPQIGGAAGGIPFVLLGFAHSATTGVLAAVLFVAYLQLENHVIQPVVVGRTVQLSPPATMTAALVGVSAGNTFTFGKYVGLSGSNPAAYDADVALDRMVELAAGRPFDVHLYAQWNGPDPSYLDPLIARITGRGLRVNLALKYVPPDGHDGDIAGFAAWVADTVRRHPTVAVWQITNEANVGVSPDSDGSAKDPVGALIAGV